MGNYKAFMDDQDYENEALKFFTTYSPDKIYDMHNWVYEDDALEYVKSNGDFIERDVVDAGCLVSILERNGYLKFESRDQYGRHLSLTKKGKEFLLSV